MSQFSSHEHLMHKISIYWWIFFQFSFPLGLNLIHIYFFLSFFNWINCDICPCDANLISIGFTFSIRYRNNSNEIIIMNLSGAMTKLTEPSINGAQHHYVTCGLVNFSTGRKLDQFFDLIDGRWKINYFAVSAVKNYLFAPHQLVEYW